LERRLKYVKKFRFCKEELKMKRARFNFLKEGNGISKPSSKVITFPD